MEGLDINESKYILQLLEERKCRIISEIEQLMHINDDDEITSNVCIACHKTELQQLNNLLNKMDNETYLKAV
jgi:hypothetical protein